MFCNNCGKKTDEGEGFCKNCGTPVAPNTNDMHGYGNANSYAPMADDSVRNKSIKGILHIVLLLLLIVLVVGVIIYVSMDSESRGREKESIPGGQPSVESETEKFKKVDLTEENEPEETKEKTEEVSREAIADCRNSYSDFLRDYTRGSDSDPRFQLGYINEDDIPELFIIDGSSHFNSVGVYTFGNNEVVHVGDFGSYGCMSYASGENRFESFNSGMGATYITYYSLNAGKAEVLYDFYAYEDFDSEGRPLGMAECSVNGVRVSEEEYNKELEKAKAEIDSKLNITIDYNQAFEINEENIEVYIAPTHSGGTDVVTDVPDEETDVETSVEQIRKWYYDTQENQDNLLYTSCDTNLECYFDGEYPAKIVAKSGYNNWDAAREYYYHDQKLYFIFVYGDIGEYRFYVEDGMIIRSIAPDGTVVDMGGTVSDDVREVGNKVFDEGNSLPPIINCGN